jgi:glutathione S-transferase
MNTIWEEIAAMIDTLPVEEQERIRAAMREWTHDLRGSLGVVFSAVGVLERRYKADNAALFDAARNGAKATMAALDELKKSYDKK